MQASELKQQAHEAGADLVGVAPASRWEGWAGPLNPRSILPRCQAVIVVGRRILRGAFRGVEEGTNFGSTYAMYGQQWHEFTFLSRTIHHVAHAVEAAGGEAVPLFGGGTGLDCKALAHAAGLGSMGKGGFFLTPAYGHRQRFGLILTDLALEGDPVVELDLCEGCDACLRACPLGALTDAGAGAAFALDQKRCAACANGRANGAPIAYERMDRFAASCGRACLVALADKVGNSFEAPFRRRSVWTRDLDGIPTVHPRSQEGASA